MTAHKCPNCARMTTNASTCGICLPEGRVEGATFATLASQADVLHGLDPFESDGDEGAEGGEELVRRTEFRIPDENLAGLQAKIERYRGRAERLGVPPPQFEVLASEWEDELLPDGSPSGQTILFHRVRVAGESPHFNGWRLRAVVDFDHEEPDSPNVVHCLDEEPDPAWRRISNDCEHCDTSRQRNKVVVVEHDSGDRKVVGSTCLKDFLGSTSPDQIASWAEMISSLDDMAESYESYDGGGGGREQRFQPDLYMAWVVRSVNASGWRSRSDPRGGATADDARSLMERFAKARRGGVPDWRDPDPLTEEEIADAEAALEWARQIPEDEPNGYLANVRAVAGKGGWRARDLGIAASIVVARNRDRERTQRTAGRKERALAAGHLGTPGEVLAFKGTVISDLPMEDGYGGVKHLLVFETEEGARVKWWASARTRPSQGRTYEVRARVKKHEVYQEMPETVILRAKFEEAPDASEVPALA